MKKQMKCPVCGQRLYDIVGSAEGELTIKCQKCKKIIAADLGKGISEKVMDIAQQGEKISCCTCNVRVFDVEGEAGGTLEVKCPRCREILSVNLSEKVSRISLHTEQIGA